MRAVLAAREERRDVGDAVLLMPPSPPPLLLFVTKGPWSNKAAMPVEGRISVAGMFVASRAPSFLAVSTACAMAAVTVGASSWFDASAPDFVVVASMRCRGTLVAEGRNCGGALPEEREREIG